MLYGSPLHAQEGITSPLNQVTRGSQLGHLPQLWGTLTSVQVCGGKFERTADSSGRWHHAADSSLTTYYFDQQGNILSIRSDALFDAECYAYRYDHRGRLEAVYAISGSDTTLSESYRYNDTNNLVTEVTRRFDSECSRITYQYSHRGLCKTLWAANGSPNVKHIFIDHRLTEIVSYNTYWAEPDDYIQVLEYDGAGRPTLLCDKLEPDNPAYWKAIEYDPWGNVILWTLDGDTVRNEYRYDLRHNWIEMTSFEDGQPYSWQRRTLQYAGDSSDFSEQRRRYDIFWVEDHVSGFVEMQYPNGDYYIGDLVEGVRQGQGDLYYADGTSFLGHFDQGLYHGYGKWHRYDADVIGRWVHGRIATDEDVEIHYFNGDRYSGPLRDGDDSCRYEGKTVFADGGSHAGEYALGRYDGFGIMRLADGTRIEGYWERGLLEGSALIVMPNLDRHMVYYEHGRRLPFCTIEYINGEFYNGETDAAGIPNGIGSFTNVRGYTRSGRFLDGKYRGRATSAHRSAP